jgi:hypothetical protein
MSSALCLVTVAVMLGATTGTAAAWFSKVSSQAPLRTTNPPNHSRSSVHVMGKRPGNRTVDVSKGRWPDGCHPDDCNLPGCWPCELEVTGCPGGGDTGNCLPYCSDFTLYWCFGCPGAFGGWSNKTYHEFYYRPTPQSACEGLCASGTWHVCHDEP